MGRNKARLVVDQTQRAAKKWRGSASYIPDTKEDVIREDKHHSGDIGKKKNLDSAKADDE